MGRAGWDRAVNLAQSEIPASSQAVGDFSVATSQIIPPKTNDPTNSVESEYPGQQHIQGTVVLSVLIGTDGSVRELKMISGDPELMEAVSDAVRRWHFKPIRLKAQPVEFETRITVTLAPR